MNLETLSVCFSALTVLVGLSSTTPERSAGTNKTAKRISLVFPMTRLTVLLECDASCDALCFLRLLISCNSCRYASSQADVPAP